LARQLALTIGNEQLNPPRIGKRHAMVKGGVHVVDPLVDIHSQVRGRSANVGTRGLPDLIVGPKASHH
jgi:hypothetical protein